jgi:hypothetical protein
VSRVAAIVPDLMLASRVQESLRAAGHEVLAVASPAAAVDADAIVCDLDAIDAAEVVAAGLPALGFYSHVDVETKRRAEEAGLGLVVPRSRMARELPQLLEKLLSD